MKKILLLMLTAIPAVAAFACPACEKQQPALLKGITHGAGPDGNWDYVIVTISVIIVLFTLFFSVKWMIRPGEQSQSHIKRLVLNNE
ncbi:MAG: hypothetical protein M3R50_07670 [Bacteroidota bacterium]|nr:hypothetical protein [Bacteroidota bacterium]